MLERIVEVSHDGERYKFGEVDTQPFVVDRGGNVIVRGWGAVAVRFKAHGGLAFRNVNGLEMPIVFFDVDPETERPTGAASREAFKISTENATTFDVHFSVAKGVHKYKYTLGTSAGDLDPMLTNEHDRGGG